MLTHRQIGLDTLCLNASSIPLFIQISPTTLISLAYCNGPTSYSNGLPIILILMDLLIYCNGPTYCSNGLPIILMDLPICCNGPTYCSNGPTY